MKSVTHTLEKGFTAVELLITLFIAAIFLFAGYQLYTQVIKDGSSAGKTAQLSSIAYERMRKTALATSAAYPSGCGASSKSTTTTTETVSGIGSVTFTVIVDCPYDTTAGNLTDIFLIKVSASYVDGGTTRKVDHATFTS